jgi:hypothetical protein
MTRGTWTRYAAWLYPDLSSGHRRTVLFSLCMISGYHGLFCIV